MGNPVKAITADMMLLRNFARQRIKRRRVRNAAVKNGIEDRHHRHILTNPLPHRLNDTQSGSIMQRCKLLQFRNPADRFPVDQRRRVEDVTAMHHPVRDPVDLFQAANPMRIAATVLQPVQQQIRRVLTGRNVFQLLVKYPGAIEQTERAAVLADIVVSSGHNCMSEINLVAAA